MRYAVLDATGLVLNTILIADPFPADYFPGYGVYLVGADAPAAPVDGRFDVLPLAVSQPVSQGDTIDLVTGAVSPPSPAPRPIPELLAYVNERRKAVAYGGCEVMPGVVVDSSADGQAMLTGVVQSFERGFITEPISFRAVNGWIDLTYQMALGAAAAVAQHIQKAFASQKAVEARIESGELITIPAVDAAFVAGML